jgi:hypothetical protein
MAVATQTITLSASSVNKIWKKVQGKLQTGIQYVCEEYADMDDVQKFEINVSAREITVPIDVNEGAGVASIAEGGYEAIAYTPNVEEITLSWINLNARFTSSLTAQYLDQYNAEAQIKRQLKHQGAHKVRDIARDFSDRFYGYSTAILAEVTAQTTATTATYTLTNGYNDTSITSLPFIADKFRANDRIALVRSGSLVSNAIGTVSSISTAGVLVVVWNGSVVSNANDDVVKANSMENTTIDGTDYNRGLVGLLDMCKSVSVHSLANTSVPNWNVSLADTGGGAFSGVKIKKGLREIENKGGGKADRIYITDGIDRNLFSTQSAALRFGSPMGMELGGDAKFKGLKFVHTRRVPPGHAIMMDSSSVRRFNLLSAPKAEGGFAWKDGDKLENQNALVFSMDFPVAMVCTSRRNLAYWTGLSES